MPSDPDIATIAAAIGQPARAAMLTVLLAGTPASVTALARAAGVTASTASVHLTNLASRQLVTAEAAGRERRYRLASVEVAQALEALQRIADPPGVRSLSGAGAAERLRLARSCYDHLAGRLGVAVTEALVARGHLRSGRDAFALTASGESWLRSLAVDVEALGEQRRGFALRCQDWSERRPHLAGAVGAAVLQRFLERGYVARLPRERALRVTPAGEHALRRELGVELRTAP
jgi:DNA-binding transcriptional ArsR family regulator